MSQVNKPSNVNRVKNTLGKSSASRVLDPTFPSSVGTKKLKAMNVLSNAGIIFSTILEEKINLV